LRNVLLGECYWVDIALHIPLTAAVVAADREVRLLDTARGAIDNRGDEPVQSAIFFLAPMLQLAYRTLRQCQACDAEIVEGSKDLTMIV